MSKVLLVAVTAIACTVLHGQQVPTPTALTPAVLYVGSQATTLTLNNQSFGPGSGLTAQWNGSPRTTTVGGNGLYSVMVQLTAGDLAVSQVATITVVNGQGAVIAIAYCPVLYNLLPRGVAFDTSRNLVYLATPAEPADTRFPGNSVVALDVTSGKVASVLQIGSALGDLAPLP